MTPLMYSLDGLVGKTPPGIDPGLIACKLVDAIREEGMPCAGDGNSLSLPMAKVGFFSKRLSKKQRTWVETMTLRRFVQSFPKLKLRLSRSGKSIILEEEVNPKECITALAAYIRSKGNHGGPNRTVVHLQLLPEFFKQHRMAIRDTMLNVLQEHRGAETLSKKTKKIHLLRRFLERHGKRFPGCHITISGHYIVMEASNEMRRDINGSMKYPSVASVKSRLKSVTLTSTTMITVQSDTVRQLQNSEGIAVDLEGRLEQADPCISLLQMCAMDGDNFVVLDLISCPELLLPPHLGGDSPVSRCLRALLSEKKLIMHDCRNDCAALWGQFGISPSVVLDTQVAYSVVAFGKKHCWKRTGFNEVASTYSFKNPLKKQVKHQEGLWEQRPLPDDLLLYAVFDVLPLPKVAEKMCAACNDEEIDLIYKCSDENTRARKDEMIPPTFLDGVFCRSVRDGSFTPVLDLIFPKKEVALRFHGYISSSESIRRECADRDSVGNVFEDWAKDSRIDVTRNLCSVVMAILRKHKLLRSKRYNGCVTMIFALPNGTFPPNQEVKKTRSQAVKQKKELETNKHGIVVVGTPDIENMVVPSGQTQVVTFTFENTGSTAITVNELQLVGVHRRRFQLMTSKATNTPYILSPTKKNVVHLNFVSPGPGVFRAVMTFRFLADEDGFSIARFITARSGESLINNLLKPKSPYKKMEKKGSYVNEDTMILAPKALGTMGKFAIKLPHSTIPDNVEFITKHKEMDSFLKRFDPVVADNYSLFWRHMLWACEYQASLDIKLFDMVRVSLVKEGRYFSLSVPGLAEGRPSVLRGDIVIVTLNNRSYQGRTVDTHMEKVILDFKPAFRSQYVPEVDRVDVRFTFGRSIYRAGHQGCMRAPMTMGKAMLFPEPSDREQALTSSETRRTPDSLHWRNRELNQEQKSAVLNVLKGAARPLPYVIFGPPGTGKTTTLVEAVYHLARHSDNLKILLVAPSNDATDNLVDRLADCFPPTEMRRVLAASRSVDEVSAKSKKYVVHNEVEEGEDVRDIMSKRIVASTVNMAAKFYNKGIPPGHFDILCVDEAGHAVETEVISVAATLMNFEQTDKRIGQLLLAGDPRQLGPIITSTLCKRYGMDISYMERLADREIYCSNNGSFPEELITKLVRNFRSHPSILKLPNEMFYDNELMACGDALKTHSMASWEHLPNRGHPVVFHAVYGENQRESNSPSWFNPQEAEVVLMYVRLLVKNSRPSVGMDDIGVITPYARQVEKIRMLLKAHDFGEVKVGSVETFQGQERRCIIVSTVRSSESFLDFDATYNLGFVNNPKRFNVTVTRAMALLVVVGQPYVLATDERHWRPFLRMCRDEDSWAGEPWQENVNQEEATLRRMGMLDEEASATDEDDGSNEEHESHMVQQEAVGFMNREE